MSWKNIIKNIERDLADKRARQDANSWMQDESDEERSEGYDGNEENDTRSTSELKEFARDKVDNMDKEELLKFLNISNWDIIEA